MKTLLASTVRKCQCPWRKMTIHSVKLARFEYILPLDIMFSTYTVPICEWPPSRIQIGTATPTNIQFQVKQEENCDAIAKSRPGSSKKSNK
jgi:hypothetical protein